MPEWGNWDYNRYIANFHHPNFRHRELERMGPGGQAVRDSRIQWSWWWQHHVFHGIWGGLDEHMPRTEDEQCWSMLCGNMAYVPEEAISFSGEPHIVRLSLAEQGLVRRQTMVGNDGVRGRRFLLDFTVREGSPMVDPRLVEKFLHLARRPSTTQARLFNLAETIMMQTIDPVLAPKYEERYALLRATRLVRPGLPRRLGSLIRREVERSFVSPGDMVGELLAHWQKAAPQLARPRLLVASSGSVPA